MLLRPSASSSVASPSALLAARTAARRTRPSPAVAPSPRPFSTARTPCSHVGSAPIPLPPSVSFSPPRPSPAGPSPSSSAASPYAPAVARVRGPKGELAVDIAPFVRLQLASAAAPAPAHLSVSVDDSGVKHQRAVWGLTRALLANAVVGVSEGYSLPLRLVGVGYRAAVEDVPASPTAPPAQRLNLKLGFAHPVLIDLPADVRASTPSPTAIVLAGIDKQRLGEVAARIRSWRVPEPYNGKGIFVGDEQVRRKEVKKK